MGFFRVTHLATELTGTFKSGTQRGAVLEAIDVWGNQVRGMGTVEAETKLKAQNLAKKVNSRFTFGGRFGNQVYADADLSEDHYVRKLLEVA